jgi:hypothetical protein
MTSLLVKRVRGLIASMLIWSVPWAVFGALIGIAYVLRLLPAHVTIMGPRVPGGLPVGLALAGAIIGALNGLAFGVILMTAERRHRLADLRTGRIGAWAALATGVTIYLLTSSLPIAIVTAAIGFMVGIVGLRLARRGAVIEDPDAAT